MNKAQFTKEQTDALLTLEDLWGETAFVLIGASALGCFMKMHWRGTYDLDLLVALSMGEHRKGLENLTGWRRHPTLEHEWLAPGNVRVDIVPSGEKQLAAGAIVWPGSSLRMSTTGLRLAFDSSFPIRLADDHQIQVASPPAIAVMKMAAYLDRPAEREKDLEDIGYLLECYADDDEVRRFSDAVLDNDLEYEQVSAFLLGKDIGAMAGEGDLEAITSFISRVWDELDPVATQARMLRSGPVAWRKDPAILAARIEAFSLGLDM
jgi:predicted nucleotidyltransferase